MAIYSWFSIAMLVHQRVTVCYGVAHLHPFTVYPMKYPHLYPLIDDLAMENGWTWPTCSGSSPKSPSMGVRKRPLNGSRAISKSNGMQRPCFQWRLQLLCHFLCSDFGIQSSDQKVSIWNRTHTAQKLGDCVVLLNEYCAYISSKEV